MKLTADTVTSVVSGFQFSGVRPETLDSLEYTLATLAIDVTGSLHGHESDLQKMAEVVLDACKMSPRKDYLMLRVVLFSTDIGVKEVVGFTPVVNIDVNSFKGLNCSGMTNLYDAAYATFAATEAYAKTLTDQDFAVNAITFIGTDGGNNRSTMSVSDVANIKQRLTQTEVLESNLSILIGINPQQCEAEQRAFYADGKFDQYEKIDSITPAQMAKLANFISKSISAQSQSLGTGSASQPITF